MGPSTSTERPLSWACGRSFLVVALYLCLFLCPLSPPAKTQAFTESASLGTSYPFILSPQLSDCHLLPLIVTSVLITADNQQLLIMCQAVY